MRSRLSVLRHATTVTVMPQMIILVGIFENAPNKIILRKSKNQGWEFAHLISERIASFEQISNSLKKRAIHLFAYFW